MNKLFKVVPLYISKNGVFHRVRTLKQVVEVTSLGKRVLVGGALLLGGVVILLFI